MQHILMIQKNQQKKQRQQLLPCSLFAVIFEILFCQLSAFSAKCRFQAGTRIKRYISAAWRLSPSRSMSHLSDPSGAFLFEHAEISRKALSVSEIKTLHLFSVLVSNLHMPVSCQTGFNTYASFHAWPTMVTEYRYGKLYTVSDIAFCFLPVLILL